MTLTALQKRCDQDDLAVNTEMVLTPLAAMQYGDSLSTPIASFEPQPNSKTPNAPYTKLPPGMNAHSRECSSRICCSGYQQRGHIHFVPSHEPASPRQPRLPFRSSAALSA
jgi:hypothetical protein